MPSGRTVCACGSQVVVVYLNGHTRCTVNWPPAENGDVTVCQTAAGRWEASYTPVGERVLAPYKRYARHDCSEPIHDLSEPLHAAQLDTWRQAATALARKQRNQRDRRRQQPITGYVRNPGDK